MNHSSTTQVTQFTYVYDGLILGKNVIGPDVIQSYFIQALVWSLGAGLLEDDKRKFEVYLRSLTNLTEVESNEVPAKASEFERGGFNVSILFLSHFLLHTPLICFFLHTQL